MGFHGINVVGTNNHDMAVVAANAIADDTAHHGLGQVSKRAQRLAHVV